MSDRDTTRSRLGAGLRPRRLRVWHLVVVPVLGMGATLLLAHALDMVVGGRIAPAWQDAYATGRTVLIAALMASLIGWLAFRYRTQYELELHERNVVLEGTRDFLASVIDGSGEAIITLDADDRIRSWNPAAQRIFGWSAEEMIGRTIERLLPDDPTVGQARREVGRQLRSGRTVRDHNTVRMRADGSRISARITWSPLADGGGAYAGSVAIVLDITAEREMAGRLMEQERLAAVGELSAQVAHEVRNPLAGIRGACEIMFAGYDENDPNRGVVEEVLRQIDRLAGTVDELLLFARPPRLERQPTDLHRLIDRVVELMRDDPRTSRVEVVRDLESGTPVVSVDPRQIEQVMLNLVLNAAWAMEFDGTIRIRTRYNGESFLVDVGDSGPGIPAETLPHVFKPFFTTRAQGTGLGLAIVRKIVMAHGGEVTAGNGDQGGAEFRLRLPVPEDSQWTAVDPPTSTAGS